MWDPASYSKGPEVVSPTCALGNRQANPSWGCRTRSSLQIGHSPSQLQLGKTNRVMTWVDTYGWESLYRNPAFSRRDNSILMEKKYIWVWTPWRGKGELCQHLPLLQDSMVQGWISQRHPILQGKERGVSECPATQLCRTQVENPVSFQHPEYLCVNSTIGERKVRKEKDKNLKNIKGTNFLLTFRTPAESLSTSHWDNLTGRSPDLSNGHPQCPKS